MVILWRWLVMIVLTLRMLLLLMLRGCWSTFLFHSSSQGRRHGNVIIPSHGVVSHPLFIIMICCSTTAAKGNPSFCWISINNTHTSTDINTVTFQCCLALLLFLFRCRSRRWGCKSFLYLWWNHGTLIQMSVGKDTYGCCNIV